MAATPLLLVFERSRLIRGTRNRASTNVPKVIESAAAINGEAPPMTTVRLINNALAKATAAAAEAR